MSIPSTPTSLRRKATSNVTSDGNENTSSWWGAIGGVMGELLQNWGILGALRKRGWGTTGAMRSSPNSTSLYSQTLPAQEQIELSKLNLQNPCYLRIEGALPGRGHNFKPTTLECPAWCDACAHLVFYHATTCDNCSYTCHEQCQDVVSLDCKATFSPDSDCPGDVIHVEDGLESVPLLGEEEPPPDPVAEEKGRDSSSGDVPAMAEEEGSPPDKDASEESKNRHNLECQKGGHTPLLSSEGEEEKREEEEKHEAELQEKHLYLEANSEMENVSTLRRTVCRIQSNQVVGSEIEEWVKKCSYGNQGLQIAKECDGSFRGCLRIHLNLCRPINIVAGSKPPSIYDILQEDRTMEKTLTSFYMPRDAVKAIHITSNTTTRDVIVALLRKFKVVDNPQKFALYEKTFDTRQSLRGKLRRLEDAECPLMLAISWSAQGFDNKRLVLQENDTADIQWEAFSLPELDNFLKILDREEEEYKNQIRDKYSLLRKRIQGHLLKVNSTHGKS